MILSTTVAISYNGYGFMSVLFLPNSKNRKTQKQNCIKADVIS